MAVRLDPRIVDAMREVRRDLHAHPELSGAEFRTTGLVAERLTAAGLVPKVLPGGTGLVCDLTPPVPGGGSGTAGSGTAGSAAAEERSVTVLRADLDALPLPDVKDVPYRSTVPDACHACGHDLHTAVLLGTGLVLADRLEAGRLPRPVRLVFQPAEEAMWGARAAIEAGALDGVGRAVALHADPRLEVGRVALRAGPITGAADFVRVRLSGPGGHTARPHLTADLVHALGVVATEAPALLARRVDPRAGLRLVWGRVSAGSAANAIPSTGELAGTLRCLDTATWDAAPDLLTGIIAALADQHGVAAEVEVTRGVPPCVNDAAVVADLRAVLAAELGVQAVAATEQSLGGEDFAWFTRAVPGALVRLGTRGPGAAETDLHTSTFDVDERAVEVGIRTLLAVATGGRG